MAHILDPEKVMETLKDGTVDAVKEFFPLKGKKNTLVAKKVYVGTDVDMDDIKSQRKARMLGKTWSTPVYGDFDLVDNESGKVLDTKKNVKLINLPHITRRYSFIVGGREYQVDNQWRLKSGVYTRERADGDLETQFNLAKGSGFRMLFDPAKKNFIVRYGTANIPLVSALRSLGVSDDTMKQKWGNEIFAAAAKQTKPNDPIKLAKALDRYKKPTSVEEAKKIIRDKYAETELRPDTTKITLGEAADKVDGNTLLLASSKLLKVSRGESEVDNRDALQFKELWTIDDFIPERIKNSRSRITRKLRNNLDRRDSVRSVVNIDTFNMPVKAFFTSTSLSQQSSQYNPLDMISGHMRTTLLGTGGISTPNAISFDAKLIDPSHLGFLDPVATPEGERTGITLHLGLGVTKKGKEAQITVWDVKNKKLVHKTPPELSAANIAFPDQYNWKGGVPSPKSKSVTVSSAEEGDPRMVGSNEVDYVLTSPKAMFSLTANMVPFLASDQANRAEMATRHLEQAISLKNREAPLVQTYTGDSKSDETWERVVGKFTSHTSPVSGKVVAVTDDNITVEDSKGEKHKVDIYNNFPLNDKKGFIDATSIVKVGDKVTKGQTLADSTYTKDGTLALGTNLKVAYLPYKGFVFEDGIVISEDASEKLTSEHLYKERTYVDRDMTLGLKKFRAHYPGVVTDENAKKLDGDGVIKVGEKVSPGDVITTAMKKTEPSKEQLLLRGVHRSLVKPWKNRSVVWENAIPGVVTDVVKNRNEVTVYIRTEEPADIGDKLSGRHGNKGVITAVLPNEEMPKDKDGNAIEIIMNPSGVPGRINVGQVLETSLGKVADKVGHPVAVNNFEPEDEKKIVKVKGHYRTVTTKEGPKKVWIESYEYDRGYQEVVSEIMDKEGVSATEELFDPETGKSLGQVMTGKQYVLKLVHQVNKKMSARAHGHGFNYDASMVPKGGGKGGGQKSGGLGLFALLAHGATGNIRDSLTYKSDKTQDDVWTAIQAGEPMPAPKPSFAYEKFIAYLNALGVNVDKEGSGLVLSPLTDEEVLSLSNGELTKATRVLRGKDLKPEAGGLFDESITGGPGGDKWSHIRLAEGVPNPMFAKAITSLLGIKGKEYEAIVDGKSALKDGEVVPASESDKGGLSSLVAALKELDVEKELAEAKEKVKTARRTELDKWNRKVKYLSMLQREGLTPDKAYILNNFPVLPPIFRPITAMEGGDLNVDGLNLLYRDVALINSKLDEVKDILPEEELASARADLYDALVALMSTGSASGDQGMTTDGQARPPGILTILSGRTSPKHGYFHQKVLDRKQDLTMRSVIVPDMNLHLDEVGLPKKGAMKIFRPFVVKELVRMGYTPLSAREEIEKGSSLSKRALEVAVAKRPVLFKRDPVLHKFGIMGFKVKLHDEASIHIHPLVVGGFNADFDGDTMSVFVPVSQKAVDEAYKMMPSKNLFNPATGRVMYQPSLEGQLGLFLLTQPGKESGKSYGSIEDAIAAAKKGDISFNDVIKVGGKKTTAGKAAFYKALPPNVQDDKYLTDMKLVMNGRNLQGALREIALKAPGGFQSAADALKDLGFGHAYNIGFSFKGEDFKALKEIRGKHLKVAEAKVAKLGKMSRAKRDKAIVDIYTQATKDMAKDAKGKLSKDGNALFAMYSAGVKPKWPQLQQLVLAPMLLQNAKGDVIPVPVTKSYAEGLTTAGYWVGSQGARKGLIEKVQSVARPGALSKQIMNTVIPYVVSEDDCETTKGVSMTTNDRAIIDRYLAKPVKAGNTTYKAGTLVTPAVATDIKSSKVGKVVVRSPLKCKAPKGMCATCYGSFEDGVKPPIGTNIGAIAGQSLGERTVQVSMKQFHTGGVAGAGGAVMSSMDRLTQLLKIPQKLPNAAVLSPVGAEVSSIKKSSAGGYDLKIGNKDVYIPPGRSVTVKKGDTVKRGQSISSGSVDPRQLLELTNIDTVQRYLADEIHKVFESEGVRKRNIEVVTKALTNLGHVEDAGDSESHIRGDKIPLSYAAHENKSLKKPMKIKPVMRGIETLALDQTTDWLARLQYRKLKETFIRGASEGWKSDIHGLHPTPGIVYSSEFGEDRKGGKY